MREIEKDYTQILEHLDKLNEMIKSYEEKYELRGIIHVIPSFSRLYKDDGRIQLDHDAIDFIKWFKDYSSVK